VRNTRPGLGVELRQDTGQEFCVLGSLTKIRKTARLSIHTVPNFQF
jgi:hypothetical protein